MKIFFRFLLLVSLQYMGMIATPSEAAKQAVDAKELNKIVGEFRAVVRESKDNIYHHRNDPNLKEHRKRTQDSAEIIKALDEGSAIRNEMNPMPLPESFTSLESDNPKFESPIGTAQFSNVNSSPLISTSPVDMSNDFQSIENEPNDVLFITPAHEIVSVAQRDLGALSNDGYNQDERVESDETDLNSAQTIVGEEVTSDALGPDLDTSDETNDQLLKRRRKDGVRNDNIGKFVAASMVRSPMSKLKRGSKKQQHPLTQKDIVQALNNMVEKELDATTNSEHAPVVNSAASNDVTFVTPETKSTTAEVNFEEDREENMSMKRKVSYKNMKPGADIKSSATSSTSNISVSPTNQSNSTGKGIPPSLGNRSKPILFSTQTSVNVAYSNDTSVMSNLASFLNYNPFVFIVLLGVNASLVLVFIVWCLCSHLRKGDGEDIESTLPLIDPYKNGEMYRTERNIPDVSLSKTVTETALREISSPVMITDMPCCTNKDLTNNLISTGNLKIDNMLKTPDWRQSESLDSKRSEEEVVVSVPERQSIRTKHRVKSKKGVKRMTHGPGVSGVQQNVRRLHANGYDTMPFIPIHESILDAQPVAKAQIDPVLKFED